MKYGKEVLKGRRLRDGGRWEDSPASHKRKGNIGYCPTRKQSFRDNPAWSTGGRGRETAGHSGRRV
ncbi:MAG: hypothetical protein IBX68_11530 [Dehalococcoidia bacterium]|nr:hypothetical protein [Dehalococcoidia bacterium]